ncbi:MAG: hypothetical protein KDB03_08195 [Planctomycetales bacterium]|nr:hypothetical protein [Planctomycetales bacterium]
MTSSDKNSANRDQLVLTVSILILVFGTAWGNAYAMFGMATLAIIGFTFAYRKSIGSVQAWTMLASLILSALIAYTVVNLS